MKTYTVTIQKTILYTTNLLTALFLGMLIGLVGCDTPAGTAGQGEASESEVNKAARESDYKIEMTDLGTLGSAGSAAYSINDKGQIVGSSATAFLWENGTMTDLGTLGGDNSRATSINNKGQIVGYADTLNIDNQGAHKAVKWENGKISILCNLGPGSEAHSINNKGQIVGMLSSQNNYNVFLLENGKLTDLGIFFGPSFPQVAINDNGQIVGTTLFPVEGGGPPGEVRRAFLWEDGEIVELGDLEDEDELQSFAYSINNQGQVVGRSVVDGSGLPSHAVLWDNGATNDLGTLGGSSSTATSINDTGQIVGYSATSSSFVHAFLWEEGTMTDLGTLGGEHSRAFSINEKGQIVGWSETSSGEVHAVLWEIKEETL